MSTFSCKIINEVIKVNDVYLHLHALCHFKSLIKLSKLIILGVKLVVNWCDDYTWCIYPVYFTLSYM